MRAPVQVLAAQSKSLLRDQPVLDKETDDIKNIAKNTGACNLMLPSSDIVILKELATYKPSRIVQMRKNWI